MAGLIEGGRKGLGMDPTAPEQDSEHEGACGQGAAPDPVWVWDVFTVLSQTPGTSVSCPGKELKGLGQPSDETQGQAGGAQRGTLVHSLLKTGGQRCKVRPVVSVQAAQVPSTQHPTQPPAKVRLRWG